MKRVSLERIFMIIPWLIGTVVLYSLFGLFAPGVEAQEPTPIPTPTLANTPLPTSPPPTETPTPGGPTATPTATATQSTPTGRLIIFRVNEEEINPGECVTFSWVTKGDIAFVEFNIEDDGVAPEFVSEEGTRQECPTENTEYRLYVMWFDNTQSTSEKIKIKVEKSSGGGGSSSSSSSSSGNSVPVPPPGTFVAVTPIFVSQPAAQPTPIPAVASQNIAPIAAQNAPVAVVQDPARLTNIFDKVQVLPETGVRPDPQPGGRTPSRGLWQSGPGRFGKVLVGLSILIVSVTFFIKQRRSG